jgi:hypothetical protein
MAAVRAFLFSRLALSAAMASRKREISRETEAIAERVTKATTDRRAE